MPIFGTIDTGSVSTIKCGSMLLLTALSVEIKVRDAVRWHGVQASLDIDGYGHKTSNGILRLDLDEGTYNVTVEAPGYSPLRSDVTVRKGMPTSFEFLLMPYTRPRSPQGRKGFAVWYGWIVDGTTLTPVPGVKVEVLTSSGKYTSITDEKGYYTLQVPVKRREAGGEKEYEKAKVVFSKDGYVSYVKEGVRLIEGVYRLNVDLTPGKGVRVKRDVHGLFEGKSASEDYKKKAPVEGGDSGEGLLATVLIPPASIKVGRNCSCRSCSSVSIVSLETYVMYGLDDEWIASWPTHSLRAGAVPYRSYGAWHVAHPINSSYDICDNTCCQVWDPSDSYVATEDAAVYTSGIMLEYGGNIARSEYSAENNNCGCGDGYAGDGSAWPCIYDPVCSGHSCYGHGRGMCQWGSSRWANRDSTWKWINDHYYNPGGMYLSTPLAITGISVSPTSACSGDTLTITLDVASYTEYTHNHIMIGASLYNGGYVDDPPRDRLVSIPPGTTSVYRYFVIPSSIAPGTYDLLAALWFDVNENVLVNSGDFMMHSRWLYSAVEICPTVSLKEVPDGKEIHFSEPFEIYSPSGRLVARGREGKVRLKKGIYFVIYRGKVGKVLIR